MRIELALLAFGLLLASVASTTVAATPSAYGEACDASAAVAIGKGRFVVADDEGNVLRIYERTSPKPVAELDLTDDLGNRDGDKIREADIEGAAVVGTRIYWIASHARKGADGTVDPFRYRFFATDIDPSGAKPIKFVGTPYKKLLGALRERFPELNAAADKGPEEAGGLNIEGLAAAGDGGLLIGFRNPIPGGRALIVPLRNPAELIANPDATPTFGERIELDLGGHGIRSFDRGTDEYWIAAGPSAGSESDPSTPHFALFRWKGGAGDKPVSVQALDAGTFRAEAMFIDDGAAELVLLSDDGDEMVDGKECKKKSVPIEKKSFRAKVVKMPSTCKVAKTASFKNVETLRLARKQGLEPGANVGIFKAPLAVNTDGAPTSYHPHDYKGQRLAINHLDNGIVIKATDGRKLTLANRIAVFERWRDAGWAVPSGYRITWQNVIAADTAGKPCVFTEENAGYFGSLTALKNKLPASAAGECGVKDQLDQRFLPAIVLRGGASNPLATWGAKKGDLVVAVNPASGIVVPAVIGDTGNDERIGEGSVALNMALLGRTEQPTTYGEAMRLDTGSEDIVVAVIPGSDTYRIERPYSRDNIEQRVTAWATEHGYRSLQELANVAVECARPL